MFAIVNGAKVGAFSLVFYDTWKPLNMAAFHGVQALALALPVWYVLIRLPTTAVGFWVLQATFLFCNAVYYDYFHRYLDLRVSAQLLFEGLNTAPKIGSLMHPLYLALLVDFPVLLVTVRSLLCPRGWKPAAAVGATTVVLLGSLELVNSLKHESLRHLLSKPGSGDVANFYGEEAVVKRYGLLLNILLSYVSSGDEGAQFAAVASTRRIVSKDRPNSQPNLVAIQVESLDAAMVGLTVDGKLVMPFLTDLSKRSFYRAHTLVYHGVGGTSDAEFSIINSMPPPEHICALKSRSYSYPNSIVKSLRAAGYEAVAFHGNSKSFYNRNSAFAAMGFNRFFDLSDAGHLLEPQWGSLDSNMFQYGLEILKRTPKPWFSFTITLESHMPWRSYRSHQQPERFPFLKHGPERDYLESMVHVDQALAWYVSAIRQEFPDAVVFIWGDHSPGMIGSEVLCPAIITRGGVRMEFVPFIVVGPGIPSDTMDQIGATFLDIGPTILSCSKVPYRIFSDGIVLIVDSNEVPMLRYHGLSLERVSFAAEIRRNLAVNCR